MEIQVHFHLAAEYLHLRFTFQCELCALQT